MRKAKKSQNAVTSLCAPKQLQPQQIRANPTSVTPHSVSSVLLAHLGVVQVVVGGVQLRHDELVSPRRRYLYSKLRVNRRQLLAKSAPGSVELEQNIVVYVRRGREVKGERDNTTKKVGRLWSGSIHRCRQRVNTQAHKEASAGICSHVVHTSSAKIGNGKREYAFATKVTDAHRGNQARTGRSWHHSRQKLFIGDQRFAPRWVPKTLSIEQLATTTLYMRCSRPCTLGIVGVPIQECQAEPTLLNPNISSCISMCGVCVLG